jgi:dihydrofolate synthase/folylpolyglutamate synthase
MTTPNRPRFPSLDQWLDWQGRLHPREIELGLERVRAVWQRMGCPRPGRVLITVGGTNGKGSCVAYLEAILRAAGYSTGAYTSPHLYRYNERIRLQGVAASDQRICEAFDRVDRARGGVTLTYFEFGTLAAMDVFASALPDVALLEVGLGGRLDAVNVVDAELALLTNVSLEHTAWLGTDRESIGREKAGIFRYNAPVVVAEPQPPESVLQRARALGCDLALSGRDYRYSVGEGSWSWRGRSLELLDLPGPALAGLHQLDNAAAVLMALEMLGDRLPVARNAVVEGLARTSLAGRFEVHSGVVTVILDVAHNPAAAGALARTLAATPCPGRTLAVLGVLGDKDLAGMAAALTGQIDAWYVSAPAAGRGMPREQAEGELRRLGADPVLGFDRLAGALEAARAGAGPGDRIVAFGSFLTVAELGGLI